MSQDKKRMEGESVSDWLKRTATRSSKWLEKARWRKENKFWLTTSQYIAMQILNILREKEITKAQFYEGIGHKNPIEHRIFSGSYNFTIEEIGKIEKFLGEKIIFVVSSNKCRFCDENPTEVGSFICIPCQQNV
jgi:uncharacterized membrane protein YheB (UPF0754 family)